jgi:UDP-galactopyranose mutase
MSDDGSSAATPIGVLALVPDDWGDPWQRRHQVLSRLAARFPVAWVGPARHWRTGRPSSSIARTAGAGLPDHGGLFILDSTAGLPAPRRPRWLQAAIARRRVRQGVDWLRRRGCTSIELQIWRPEFAGALDWAPFTRCSYHVDDEYSWSWTPRPMAPEERRLLERADRVYVTSPGLLASKGGVNPRTALSPNGVDYRAFSSAAPEPGDLARIPRPRVGYVGVLKEQLDWDLLSTLATRRPDWSFVLVGPARKGHDSVHERLAALRRRPNVHLLGPRDPVALPGYLQGLDVTLLPYRRNAYTDCINPLKLYEALAAGTPVVASRLRTLEAFAPVITLADAHEDWPAAIDRTLSGEARDPSRRRARQAAARPYDWDAIVEPLAADIAGRA